MIRKPTWIFLLVFLVLLGGVYLWQRKEMQTAAETTPTASAAQGFLFNIEGTLASVRIERVGDRVLELKADDQGQWTITWPEGLETDHAAASTALAQLVAVPVVATLAQTPDLAAMGLTQPVYRILVTTSDGKSYVANIGKATPTNSGYYVLSSSRNVSIISTFTLDPILELVDNPPVQQATAAPEPGTPVP